MILGLIAIILGLTFKFIVGVFIVDQVKEPTKSKRARRVKCSQQ